MIHIIEKLQEIEFELKKINNYSELTNDEFNSKINILYSNFMQELEKRYIYLGLTDAFYKENKLILQIINEVYLSLYYSFTPEEIKTDSKTIILSLVNKNKNYMSNIISKIKKEKILSAQDLIEFIIDVNIVNKLIQKICINAS